MEAIAAISVAILGEQEVMVKINQVPDSPVYLRLLMRLSSVIAATVFMAPKAITGLGSESLITDLD